MMGSAGDGGHALLATLYGPNGIEVLPNDVGAHAVIYVVQLCFPCSIHWPIVGLRREGG